MGGFESMTDELLEQVTGGQGRGDGSGGGPFGPGKRCEGGEIVGFDEQGRRIVKRCVNGKIVHE